MSQARSAGMSPAPKKYTFWTDIRRNPFSYLLLLPAMIFVFVFGYMTYPYMIIAFKKFNYQLGVWGSEWSGIENFAFFFKSTVATRVIWNTLYLNLLFIITGILSFFVFRFSNAKEVK